MIPRPCPFCHYLPETTAHHRDGKLNMYNISCHNDYCMVQPMVQMYGKEAQKNAVAYWNGMHPAVQRCRNCKHCDYQGYCNYHEKFTGSGLGCSDWESKSIEPPGDANIYHTSEDEHSVYWCGWCGHICSVHDKYCSDCGAEFGEVIEV